MLLAGVIHGKRFSVHMHGIQLHMQSCQMELLDFAMSWIRKLAPDRLLWFSQVWLAGGHDDTDQKCQHRNLKGPWSKYQPSNHRCETCYVQHQHSSGSYAQTHEQQRLDHRLMLCHSGRAHVLCRDPPCATYHALPACLVLQECSRHAMTVLDSMP